MPKKLTGGKHGRPLKSVSRNLSPLQEKFVLYVLLDSNSKTKLKGYELAKKVGATSAAISKWKRDPIIIDAIRNCAANYPALAAQVAEFRREAKSWTLGTQKLHDAEIAPFNEAWQQLRNLKDNEILDWLSDNWERGVILDEGMPAFRTKVEILEYFREHKKLPREWTDKVLELHPRQKNQTK